MEGCEGRHGPTRELIRASPEQAAGGREPQSASSERADGKPHAKQSRHATLTSRQSNRAGRQRRNGPKKGGAYLEAQVDFDVAHRRPELRTNRQRRKQVSNDGLRERQGRANCLPKTLCRGRRNATRRTQAQTRSHKRRHPSRATFEALSTDTSQARQPTRT